MGLKKRNKTSAEFSMASLTDVIFLLLIFFMLSSQLVGVTPFDLPESDSQTVAATSITVAIRKDGTHSVNGGEISRAAVARILQEEVRKVKPEDRDELTITIVAEVGTPFDYVTDIMETSARLRARAIIATQPRQN